MGVYHSLAVNERGWKQLSMSVSGGDGMMSLLERLEAGILVTTGVGLASY